MDNNVHSSFGFSEAEIQTSST